MDYIKLISGICLLALCTWLFLRNKDRRGFIHSLFRLDTVVGIIAGAYLMVSSIISMVG